jgi:hypothetical protein
MAAETGSDGWPEHFNLGLTDRVIGVGLSLGRFIGHISRHLTHEGLSDHFQAETRQTTRMAVIERNYDANGSRVEPIAYADPLTHIHDMDDAWRE